MLLNLHLSIYFYVFLLILILLVRHLKHFFLSKPSFFGFLLFMINAAVILNISSVREEWKLYLALAFVLFILLYGLYKLRSNEIVKFFISLAFIGIFVSGKFLSKANWGVWHFVGFSYLMLKVWDAKSYICSKKFDKFDPWLLLNYLFYFPSFLCGPIMRLKPFEQDYRSLFHNKEYEGDLKSALNILLGFSFIRFVVPLMIQFNPPTDQFWYGAFLLLRIYFELEGASLIAIGASGLVGIRCPENFNRPWLAQNLQDFWNRWHLSLSQWARDHLFYRFYAKLEDRWGKMSDQFKFSLATLVTFIFIGLWHGFTRNWLYYGALHGLGIICMESLRNSQFLLKREENFMVRLAFKIITWGYLIWAMKWVTI